MLYSVYRYQNKQNLYHSHFQSWTIRPSAQFGEVYSMHHAVQYWQFISPAPAFLEPLNFPPIYLPTPAAQRYRALFPPSTSEPLWCRTYGVLLKKSNHYIVAMAAVVLDRRSSGNLPILGSGCSGISNWEMQRPCLEKELEEQGSIFRSTVSGGEGGTKQLPALLNLPRIDWLFIFFKISWTV